MLRLLCTSLLFCVLPGLPSAADFIDPAGDQRLVNQGFASYDLTAVNLERRDQGLGVLLTTNSSGPIISAPSSLGREAIRFWFEIDFFGVSPADTPISFFDLLAADDLGMDRQFFEQDILIDGSQEQANPGKLIIKRWGSPEDFIDVTYGERSIGFEIPWSYFDGVSAFRFVATLSNVISHTDAGPEPLNASTFIVPEPSGFCAFAIASMCVWRRPYAPIKPSFQSLEERFSKS